MAAKLLHSLADDNPDLQKQIGCMTGIFQMFDRQHILAGRRVSPRRHSLGNSNSSKHGSDGESNHSYNQQTSTEISYNRNMAEKERNSIEPSRQSFSSSCSSPLSSSEPNKTAQPEASTFDRIIFPETPSRDQSSLFPYQGRHSLDLRDVVKDSMYREGKVLSVKTTTKEELASRAMRRREDSPRPLQLSKSEDETYSAGKQRVAADLKESLRALAKLREAPRYYNNEIKEVPKSSYDPIEGSWHSIPKDAPRYSFDSTETSKLTIKLKELPRLSLDSREQGMRGSNSQDGNSNNKVPTPVKSSKRPPSVVAKLMGLETLPDSPLAKDDQEKLVKTSLIEEGDRFPKPLRGNSLNKPTRTSPKSPRSSTKDPVSPRWKNPDLVMRPFSGSRLPMELGPWKQASGSRSSQKPAAFLPVKAQSNTPNSLASDYSELEKRLKDLEFKQSGKDLKALKQILEVMQAKVYTESQNEAQSSNLGSQSYKQKFAVHSQNFDVQGKPQSNPPTTRGSASFRSSDSPIVIMKPAKLAEKAGIPASSLIPIHSLSGLNKLRSPSAIENKKISINSRVAKDRSPRSNRSELCVNSNDSRASNKNLQSSSKPQQSGSAKNSGSISPRLQQKKPDFDKRSRPPTPPSDSSKTRKHSNRQPTEVTSPGGKSRPKPHYSPLNDNQLNLNESRTSSDLVYSVSHQSESSILELKTEVQVSDTEKSVLSVQADKYLIHGSMHKESPPRLSEDVSLSETSTVSPDAPSPVSVLHASLHRKDNASAGKQILDNYQGDGAQETYNNQDDDDDDDQWSPMNKFSDNIESGLSSEINRKKLQNIDHLVQKLRRLNSSHDEACQDYIGSLCENTNPDHRYISEILLASGLLLRDLGSGLSTFQLHPSGHPINPELFLVLEQTKGSTLLPKNECKPLRSNTDNDKLHRKLIFDGVNEILLDKLEAAGATTELWFNSGKLTRKTLSAQKLLKELCWEIEQLQTKKSEDFRLKPEEDGLKSILCEDVMKRSESWTDIHGQIPGVVLDVERSIFKDLVDEIIRGEANGLRMKALGRQQLV